MREEIEMVLSGKWVNENSIKKSTYTVEDARREVKECLEEGYGFNYIRIFLNDLSRSKDITWKENSEIMKDLIEGKFGDVECSYNTL